MEHECLARRMFFEVLKGGLGAVFDRHTYWVLNTFNAYRPDEP